MNAILKRDVKTAEALLIEHIRSTQRSVLTALAANSN
jgi:DNA-binding GntR family transcriptional regulator